MIEETWTDEASGRKVYFPALKAIVETVAERFGAKVRSTWLVGHSQGGLTSKRLLRDPWWGVLRLDKGHTEGLEPNVMRTLLELVVSAPGGKLASVA